MTEEEKELYEERVAICTVDGEMPEMLAKIEADRQLKKWRESNNAEK